MKHKYLSLLLAIVTIGTTPSISHASFFANSTPVNDSAWREVPGLGYYLPDTDGDGWIYTAYFGNVYIWDATDGSATMTMFVPHPDFPDIGQTFWVSQAETPLMWNFERSAWVATWGNFRPWLPRIQSLEFWREDVEPFLGHFD